MARRADARRPAEDGGLWQRAVRDVAPLRSRDASPPIPPPAPRPPPPLADCGPGPAPAPSVNPSPPPSLDGFAGIDRANAERLKRGQRAIEARLDLHGLTQTEAHRALCGFVTTSRTMGRRCVLVITGRGRLGGGILKDAVPRWLDEAGLRPHVLAIAPAQPQHGGGGALYLLLRRLPRPQS